MRGMSKRWVLRFFVFFFSSRRRHTRWTGDWSSDVCSSDLVDLGLAHPARSRGTVRGSQAGRGLYRYRPVDARTRSEERRVGKECRARWVPYLLTEIKDI